MEFKYGELNYLADILKRMYQTCKLPIKDTARLSRFIKSINSEIDNYREVHDKIIKDFADYDENGELQYEETEINGVMTKTGIKVTNIQECATKLNELAEFVFTLEFTPISLDLLTQFEISVPEFETFNERLFA